MNDPEGYAREPRDETFAAANVGPGVNRWWIGAEVMIHNAAENKFVWMTGGNAGKSATSNWNTAPRDASWGAARFTVVDVGEGFVAFHNAAYNGFLRMTAHGKLERTSSAGVDAFPWPHWTNARFRVVDADGGQIAIYNEQHKRFIKMDASTDLTVSESKKETDIWYTHNTVRFRIVMTRLPIGVSIALHNGRLNRYIRMPSSGGTSVTVTTSDTRSWEDLPWDWRDEKFRVVDAGDGQIALHCTRRNRFLQMHPDGRIRGGSFRNWWDLPASFTYERFRVVDVGDGEIALHNAQFNRFVRVNSDATMASSTHMTYRTRLPEDWLHERFRVVNGAPFLAPGSRVALHSALAERFLASAGSNLFASPVSKWNHYPSDWVSEKWTIVDAGKGDIALHSPHRNRFLIMRVSSNSCSMGCSESKGQRQLPATWTGARWRAVYGGNGKIAFYNVAHNRYMKMDAQGNIGCAPTGYGEYNLPTATEWPAERFRIVLVRPPNGATIAINGIWQNKLVRK